jgi:hypothetical protein
MPYPRFDETAKHVAWSKAVQRYFDVKNKVRQAICKMKVFYRTFFQAGTTKTNSNMLPNSMTTLLRVFRRQRSSKCSDN